MVQDHLNSLKLVLVLQLHQEKQRTFESSNDLVVILGNVVKHILNVDLAELLVVVGNVSVHGGQTVLKYFVVSSFTLQPLAVVHLIHD